MTQEYYSIITNTGLAKHAAAALGGDPINLTHIAVGDSNGTSYNPVATATALQNERCRVSTTYVTIDEDNPNQIIVEAIINETVGPFYIREVGVFDADGDLFAIGKFPETFKPNLPTGSGKRLYVRMILGFTSSPQVSLVLSEDINNDPNFSTNIFNALATKLAKAQNLADLADAAEARGNLGLEIGVDVQAQAANLSALAALVGAINKIPYFTGAGTLGMVDLFPNKNAIINGDFNIWQRGTSFTSVANGVYTADRFIYFKVSTSAVHDISRSSDVPTVAQAGKLFNYSLLADCQTADVSVGAADYAAITQPIEGYNWAALAQKDISLSFWVKATKPGKYCISLQNSGVDRCYVAEYTINAADTWEYKAMMIPASPSAGTWNYTNGVGLFVNFVLMCGSNWQNSPGGWIANSQANATSNQVNACDNIANNFRICGVQLESGPISTPFERRSIQQEIILCQRYYEKSYDIATAPGSPTQAGIVQGSSSAAAVTTGFLSASTKYSVRKRVVPTITFYDSNGAINKCDRLTVGSSTNQLQTPSLGYSGESGFDAYSSGSTNNATIQYQYTANAEF